MLYGPLALQEEKVCFVSASAWAADWPGVQSPAAAAEVWVVGVPQGQYGVAQVGEEVAALLGEVLHEGPGLCGRHAVPTSGEHAQHHLLLLPEHPVIVPGIEEAGLVPTSCACMATPTSSLKPYSVP